MVNWTLRNKLQWNCNHNTKFFIYENATENFFCEMAAILSMGKGVNWFVQKDFQYTSIKGANQKVSEIWCTYAQRCNILSQNGTIGYICVHQEHEYTTLITVWSRRVTESSGISFLRVSCDQVNEQHAWDVTANIASWLYWLVNPLGLIHLQPR